MKEKIFSSLDDLFSDLTTKEKDIFFKRFGLGDKKYSLEAIGQKYNLTRERIRQIQNNVIDKLRAKILVHKFFKEEFYQVINDYLGNLKIKRLKYLLINFQNKHLLNEKELKILEILLKIHPIIYHFEEDKKFHSFIYLNKNDLEILNRVAKEILEYFEEKKTIIENDFFNYLQDRIKNYFHIWIDLEEIYEFIKLFKIIFQNPFNEFGTIENFRISPSNLIDKIRLILEFENKPLSYYQIYQKLNELRNIENELIHPIWKKNYSLKTIHSTLNSNKNFVLVGRGTYALNEWGNERGTILEIMKNIIKENNGLTIDELYQLLQKKRIFSKNTFYVYLYRYFKVINNKIYLK